MMINTTMNYTNHYEKLIQRAKNRETVNEYTEIHHIVPRCIGGTNSSDNLVRLFPEEHFIAHQLLIRIYNNHHGLIYAAYMMGLSRSNKKYGWLRRLHAESISSLMAGKPKTLEHRQKLSKSQKGKPSPKKGCTHTEETKKKISKAQTGKIATDETKEKQSKFQTGRPRPEEENIRRSLALMGKPKSEEVKLKMKMAQAGRRLREKELHD